MNRYVFTVTWEDSFDVDADTEDEAWQIAYESYPDRFGKSKGTVYVNLDEGNDEKELWGQFDTDPEDTDVTELVTEHDKYF